MYTFERISPFEDPRDKILLEIKCSFNNRQIKWASLYLYLKMKDARFSDLQIDSRNKIFSNIPFQSKKMRRACNF